jgi:medium-chain acyl-[acyl-carrier-protein] hydrolase
MGSAEASWWALSTPSAGAALRMFCFPYAGGNASIFRNWHIRLPNCVEVYGIQLPGRCDRFAEYPLTRMAEVVSKLGPALLPLLRGPFAFFGHSMGAILSFEAARWLQRTHQIYPRHLYVSGRRAPHIPDMDPPLHQLNQTDFIGRLSQLNGIPTEILASVEMLEVVLPVLRADAEVCETYQYVDDVPLRCPITAFGGKDDGDETLERMEEWCKHTTSHFRLHALEGGHFFIHSNELALLNILEAELRNDCLWR